MTTNLFFGTLKDEKSAVALKHFALKKQIVYNIYKDGPLSNLAISEFTKISLPTVTRLLEDLFQSNILRQEGVGKSFGGRRPILYGIEPNAAYTLGIDISLSYFTIGIINMKGQFAGEVVNVELPIENSLSYLEKVYEESQKVIKQSGVPAEKIIGVGISVPGLLNPANGRTFSHFTFSNKPVRALLASKFGIPVFLDNDARLAVLGEHYFGDIREKKNVICLNVGEGIGLGIIANGRLFHGANGFAGEIGHFKIHGNDEKCVCGKNGCVETIAAGPGLVKQALQLIKEGKQTSLKNIKNLHYNHIINEALKGDNLSIELIKKSGEHVGYALAIAINLLNPEVVIVNGSLSKAKNIFFDALIQSVDIHSINNIRREAKIMLTEMDNQATLLGTHTMVINKSMAGVIPALS